MLIAVKKNEAQALLLQGLEMKWTYDNHSKVYANKLLPKVIAFEDSVTEVMQKSGYVD
jgi:hypothetical protein